MQVAQTILEQIGGKRFLVMTGAKNLVGTEDSLMFSIPTSNKINKVRVTLTPADTYTVEFMNFSSRKLECSTLKKVDDVYCDMLAYIFETYTGLYTKF
jgi:hypothetical protein